MLTAACAQVAPPRAAAAAALARAAVARAGRGLGAALSRAEFGRFVAGDPEVAAFLEYFGADAASCVEIDLQVLLFSRFR